MTWAFDTIQEFLGHIKTVKDPELFETAIEYIQRLMGSIHDIDHALDNKIAKALDRTSAYKKIKEFNQEAERRRARAPQLKGSKKRRTFSWKNFIIFLLLSALSFYLVRK